MNLQPHDLHVILDRTARTGRVFDHVGTLLLACEARNRTVNDGAPVNQRWAPCPPGVFRLGAPIPKNTAPFGAWFLPLEDWDAYHTIRGNGRVGIGIHGGGSGLPDPFAAHQGWVVTHGCWRLQNDDLRILAGQVQAAQKVKGMAYVTVVWPFGTAPATMPDDWADVPEDGLAEDE